MSQLVNLIDDVYINSKGNDNILQAKSDEEMVLLILIRKEMTTQKTLVP